MTKTIIQPADSPTPAGPYSHAVRVGDFLFCSGQIPLDPGSGVIISGGIKAQTERVLENIRTILDSEQLTFTHVVKTTVFLTNLAEFNEMNEVYVRYFTAAPPARSTVEVSGLPRNASVEIEVVAHY